MSSGSESEFEGSSSKSSEDIDELESEQEVAEIIKESPEPPTKEKGRHERKRSGTKESATIAEPESELIDLLYKIVEAESKVRFPAFEKALANDREVNKRRRENICELCRKKFKLKAAFLAHSREKLCKEKFVFQSQRIKCLLTGCKKDFLNLPGIQYHLANHKHTLEDIMNTELGDRTYHEKLRELTIDPNIEPIAISCSFKSKLSKTGEIVKDVIFDLTTETVHSTPDPSKKKSKHKIKVDLKNETKPPKEFTLDITSSNLEFVTLSNEVFENSFANSQFQRLSVFHKSEINVDLFSSSKNLNGYLVNPGMIVYSLSWAPGNKENFLAVGGDLQDRLQEYGESVVGENIILIYKMDKAPILVMTLSHSYGHVKQLTWISNITKRDDQLGILCAVFGDNSLRMAEIPTPSDSLQHIVLKDWYWEISPDYLDDTITTMSINIENKLAVGTSAGKILVWEISNRRMVFCYPLHEYPVVSICWCKNNFLITSSLAGGFIKTNIDDVLHSEQINSLIAGSGVCYSNDYCGCINQLAFTTNNHIIKLVSPDSLSATEMTNTSMFKNFESDITYSKANKKISNRDRFIAISSRDGSVGVIDLAIVKPKSKAGVFTRLYGIEEKESILKFKGRSIENRGTSKYRIYDPSVSVNDVAWNHNSALLLASGGQGWFRIDPFTV